MPPRPAATWSLTVALGLAGTGLILAQAGLLARAAGRRRHRRSAWPRWRGPLIALALGPGRPAPPTSYGGEVAALRAAATVKSQLRRQLIDRLLRRSPAPGPGAGADGELATLATRGLDGLDAYFARYLPQLVLAVLVPLAVLIRVALADWLSALIIAVTLPLVPVFAVLVGLQHQGQDPPAVGPAGPARRSLPRRRRGPAHAARLRPRPGPGDQRSPT